MEAKPKANRFTPVVYARAVTNAIRAAATSRSDGVSPPLSGRPRAGLGNSDMAISGFSV